MRVRRCAHLLLEPREVPEFDLAALSRGDAPVRRRFAWMATVPWRAETVAIDESELLALAHVSESGWDMREEIEQVIGDAVLARLLAKGLVVAEGDPATDAADRDRVVREQYWFPQAATHHIASRWTGVDQDSDSARLPGYDSMRNLEDRFGPPPPALHERVAPELRLRLPEGLPTAMDVLWKRRVTCRNFDPDAPLALAALARVLGVVFGVQGGSGVDASDQVLKKFHPSGGALHPLEAYVLCRRVESIPPGVYHYHAGQRALEPLDPVDDLDRFAHACCGGQGYLSTAPALVIVAARFARSFWKYRRHAKAYRALLLEAGHASQNLYLAATELGLGAFITAAINEVEIERGFGLDPLAEGALAVCGFGQRDSARSIAEFDPAKQVWRD